MRVHCPGFSLTLPYGIINITLACTCTFSVPPFCADLARNFSLRLIPFPSKPQHPLSSDSTFRYQQATVNNYSETPSSIHIILNTPVQSPATAPIFLAVPSSQIPTTPKSHHQQYTAVYVFVLQRLQNSSAAHAATISHTAETL